MNENPYVAPQTPDSQPSVPAPPFSMKSLLFSFQGRINRAKYWGGILGIYAVVIVIVIILSSIFGTETVANEGSAYMTDEELGATDEISGLGLAGIVVAYIGFIWIALAIQVKRWHDRDKSGWMVLVNLIPIVGGFWALIECGFLVGTRGPNSYGPDPLG